MAKIQVRRGTLTQLETLTSGNYLDVGELGFTTDTEEVYVGTGLTSDLKHLIGKVMVDIFANRPIAGISGRMFHSSDTDSTYVDDGVAWVDVSSGITNLDDIADGTVYVRARVGALDDGYVVQLTDNTGANPLTKTSIDTHLADNTKHFIIDDLDVQTNETWSSQKIQDSISQVVSGLDPQESVIAQIDLTTSEPVTPSIGDRYINTATGNSSETTQAVTIDNIYEWNGVTWTETVVSEGMYVWDETLDTAYVYSGTAWVKFGSTVTHNNLAGLNVGDYLHLTAAEYAALGANDHVPVTVTDGSTINFTLTGQDITAETIDGAINHNALLNTHDLTSDIDHNTITNGHNLTTDINHDTIFNTHNLTTDIDHNQLTNYVAGQHVVLTVADTASIDMTLSGDEITSDLLLADGGTFV